MNTLDRIEARRAYLHVQSNIGLLSEHERAELSSLPRLVVGRDDDGSVSGVFAFPADIPGDTEDERIRNWHAQANDYVPIAPDDTPSPVTDRATDNDEQPAPDDDCRTRPATAKERMLFGDSYKPRTR